MPLAKNELSDAVLHDPPEERAFFCLLFGPNIPNDSVRKLFPMVWLSESKHWRELAAMRSSSCVVTTWPSSCIAKKLTNVSFTSPAYSRSCSSTIHCSVELPAIPKLARTSVIERKRMVLVNIQRCNRQQQPCHHRWWCSLRDVQYLTNGHVRCYQSALDLITSEALQPLRMHVECKSA